MSTLETKSWSSPDDSMTPDKTHAATIKFGPVSITKANMQPGWEMVRVYQAACWHGVLSGRPYWSFDARLYTCRFRRWYRDYYQRR